MMCIIQCISGVSEIIQRTMHIVNPSGVKFTNKYLSWFRCLGLGDHGFGGAANEGKKAASNVALPGNVDKPPVLLGEER